MAVVNKEICEEMGHKVNSIHYDRGNFFVAVSNKVLIFDSVTFDEDCITYPTFNTICQMTTSMDGLMLYVLFAGGHVVASKLQRHVAPTELLDEKTTHVIKGSMMMHPMYIASGEKGQIFAATLHYNSFMQLQSVVDVWDIVTCQRLEVLNGDIDQNGGLAYFSRHKKLAGVNFDNHIVVWNIVNHTHQVSDRSFWGRCKVGMANEDTIIAYSSKMTIEIVLIAVNDITSMKKVRFRHGCMQAPSFKGLFGSEYLGFINLGGVFMCHIDSGACYQTACYRTLGNGIGAISENGLTTATMMSEEKFCLRRTNIGVIPPLMVTMGDYSWSFDVSLYIAGGVIKDEYSEKTVVITAKTIVSINHPSRFSVSNSAHTGVTTRKRKLDEENDKITCYVENTSRLHEWMDAISAVISVKTLPLEEQALRTNANIIGWYKFDLLQLAKHRKQHRGIFGLAIPKEVMQLIGQYVINK